MKIKKFLKSKILNAAIICSPLLFLTSAKIQNNKQQQNNPSQQISPLFDTFAEKAKKEVEKGLKKSLDKVISFVNKELDKLKDLNNKPEDNYINKLERKIYFTILKTFFNKHKDDIVLNYKKYGFHSIFPFIISKEKKYHIGKIKFNNKIYTDVKIGNNSELDYSQVLDKSKDLLIKEKEQNNFLTNEVFTRMIKKYSTEMEKQIIDIVFSDSDIQKIGKDIFLIEGQFDDPHNSTLKINGFSISKPKDFLTWDDFIISKIKPRYVEFDLKQNEESKNEEEQKQDPPTTPPNIPPLVPNKPPKDPITTNPTQISESLLTLEPMVSYKYHSQFQSDLKSLFDNSTNKEKEEFFFFINPINTRYKYTVENIDISNNSKFLISVKITDLSKPSLSRKYLIEKENFYYLGRQKRQYLWEKQMKNLGSKFGLFYESLNLDYKINYSKLANDDLQLSLFSMVNLAANIVNDVKFKVEWNAILDDNSNKVNIGNGINDPILNKTSNQIFEKLLNALCNSKINGQPYWYSIINSFEIVRNDLKAIAILDNNKKAVIDKFKSFNLGVDRIDKLFQSFDLSLLRLKSISKDWTKNFNLEKWFYNYVDNIKNIMEHLQILRVLLDPKKVEVNTQQHSDLIANYDKALDKINEYKNNENQLKISLSVIFMFLGLASLITTITIYVLKYRKNINKNTLSFFTISGIISLIVTIVGAILLFLGLKG